MTETYRTEHVIDISAKPAAVYDIIADVTRWPWIFGPTILAEQVSRDGANERIKIWATANDEVKAWTSARELDEKNLRIAFRQERSQSPVASMGGVWSFEPVGDNATRVVLSHDFAAIGDDPEGIKWIQQAVDRNSHAELGALKSTAELGDRISELVFSIEDTVPVAGRIDDVYEFIYRAQDWPELVPHVVSVDLREDTPDIQLMTMDTRTPAGHVHTTKSIRICFPSSRIIYKQLEVPPLMTTHIGEWQLTNTPKGPVAIARHTVAIRPAAIPGILGENATLADARDFLSSALSTNSTTTLKHAMLFAESRTSD